MTGRPSAFIRFNARTAKATLKGIDVHRMIKRGLYYGSQEGIDGEIGLANCLFCIAALEVDAIGAPYQLWLAPRSPLILAHIGEIG